MSMNLTCGEFVGLAYASDDELREFAEEILAENAKLREYVEWLEDWVLRGFFTKDIEFEIEMKRRELGIEVDE